MTKPAKEQLARQMAELKSNSATRRRLSDRCSRILSVRLPSNARQAIGISRELEKQLEKLTQQAQAEHWKKWPTTCASRRRPCKMAKTRTQLLIWNRSNRKWQLADQLQEGEIMEDALEQIAAAKEDMKGGECGVRVQALPGRWQQSSRAIGRAMELGLDAAKASGRSRMANVELRHGGVRQKVGKGAATVTGMATVPTPRGKCSRKFVPMGHRPRRSGGSVIRSAIAAGYREHAKKYFDALREGENK